MAKPRENHERGLMGKASWRRMTASELTCPWWLEPTLVRFVFVCKTIESSSGYFFSVWPVKPTLGMTFDRDQAVWPPSLIHFLSSWT